MAGIDHTIIRYKDGKEFEFNYVYDHKTKDGDYDFQNDRFIFKCDRDGLLYSIKDKTTQNEIGQDKFEIICPKCESYYETKYFYIPFKILRKILKKMNFKKKFYHKKYFHYKGYNYEIFGRVTDNENILFILCDECSFVSIGGYGHYSNPYTHFYKRGYGKDFDSKMLTECYSYLCDTILPQICDNVLGYGWNDYDDIKLKKYHTKLNFKSYWRMTDNEKEVYFDENK